MRERRDGWKGAKARKLKGCSLSAGVQWAEVQGGAQSLRNFRPGGIAHLGPGLWPHEGAADTAPGPEPSFPLGVFQPPLGPRPTPLLTPQLPEPAPTASAWDWAPTLCPTPPLCLSSVSLWTQSQIQGSPPGWRRGKGAQERGAEVCVPSFSLTFGPGSLSSPEASRSRWLQQMETGLPSFP